MTFRIKLRRDTAAAWTSANPILAAGEPGLETDTGKVKYGDGTTAWSSLGYSGGGNSLNDEGGVVVTAGSTEHWVAAQRREDKNIYGRGVRYDSEGNSYTLTETQDDADTIAVITKYSPTGTLLWQHSIDQAQPCALAVDSNDNAYIALEGNDDNAHLIKFASNGSVTWKKEYDAGQWQGEAFIEERTSTRLVMTLNFQDSNPYRVLVLDINTTTGDVVTSKILINSGNDMYATGIDTDANGNVFVSGRYVDSGDSKDKMFVEKLDGNLDRVWSKSLETDTTYSMNAGDCASDAQGNVYAVGYYNVDVNNFDGNGSQTAGVLIKLNSSGVTQWTRRLGPGPCGMSVVGLTATDTGDLYLVTTTLEYKNDDPQLSEFDRHAQGISRMIVAKYDTAGAVLWQRYVDAEHVWEDNDDFRGQTIAVYNDKFIVDFYGRSSNTIPWNFGGTDDEEDDYFLVQLPTDGTELEFANLAFKESRIPGRFVTHTTSASPTTNEVFEGTVAVATSDLALDTVARVSNLTVRSDTYDYVFGADGTFKIPNDGDLKLTQNQIGWMASIGGAVNDNYDTHGRAVTADSEGNMYVVGEDDDTGQPIVVKISPEGQRVWSVSIEDDNNGNGGRANAVALHPANGNVYVACEMWGNYYYGLLVVIDQDTGRILDYTDYTDASNDVYLNDIVFQSDNAFVIGGSKNGNFADQGPFTAEAGSAVSKLILNRADVSGSPSTSWQIGGDGFSVYENVAAVEQYSNLTSTVQEGSGAVFDLVITDVNTLANVNTTDLAGATASGTMVKNSDNIVTQGSWGSWLVFPDNALRVTLEGLFTMNQVIPVTWTANSTTLNGYVTIQFPGDGTWQMTPVEQGGANAIAGTWYFPMSFVTPAGITVTVTNGGSNYLAGHRIKIPYTSVGGSTTDSDVVVTVTGTSGGAITTAAATQSTVVAGTYTSVSGTNYLTGSGFGFSYFNGPTVSTNYTDTNGYNNSSYGTNYAVGDVIKISGDQLGGTSPANDLIITVTSLGGSGEANGFNFSGTAQSTTWSIITTTGVDFSQPGSWSFSVPLSRENLLIGDGFKVVYGTNTGDYTDRTYAIAVDSNDNIITATQGYGKVNNNNSYNLAAVYKFNATGTLQWAKQLNERSDDGCEAKGVTTIGTDIYVTHYSYYNGETIISKLDASGVVKWQRFVDTGSDSIITATSDGDLLIAAEAYNNDIGDDGIKLFKLNPNGETVYKRWLFATNDNDTRFKNGRCLYERDGNIYITSYFYANNYDSWFVARLPLDGSGTGEYGQYRYMDTVPMTGSYWYSGLDSDTNYLIGEVGSTYAGSLGVEPYVDTTISSITTVGGDFYVNSFYPDYDYEVIRDQDGGRIVFADGTTQNTSAIDTPQRLYQGQRYTLGLGDRGHHILCRETGDNILIPYNARVPFPIGTTITIVNDSGGGSIYIGTEGGGTSLMVAGNGNWGGAEVTGYGVATLLKIETEKWVIWGNVNSW